MLLKGRKFRLVWVLIAVLSLVLFGCSVGGSTNKTTSLTTETSSEVSTNTESTSVNEQAVSSSSEAESEISTTVLESTSTDTSAYTDDDLGVVEDYIGAWYPVYILDNTLGGFKIKHPFQVIVINRDGTVSVSDIGEDLKDKSGNGTGVTKYVVDGDSLISTITTAGDGEGTSGSNSVTIIMRLEGGFLRFKAKDDNNFEIFMVRDRDNFDFSGIYDPEGTE